MTRFLTPFVAAAVLIGVYAAGRPDVPAPSAAGPAASPPAASPGAPVGNVGCAAANCHGRPDAPSLTGPPPSDCWRSSYTHWRAVDPHGRAYQALAGDLAVRMIRRLGAADPSFNKTPVAEPRCLACHTNPALAGPRAGEAFGLAAPAAAALRADGVGCEGCHGNAGGWRFAHADWRTLPDRRESLRAHGMIWLGDPAARAAACAGCHVGAPADPPRGYPDRDLTHDMIAAGHPRLNFDFRTYQRLLRPHWYEPPAPAGSAARDWLVGRVVAAEALVAVHADRAARGYVPELSEFECFAFHHAITPGGWRGRVSGRPDRRPGSAPWRLPWPLGKPGVLTPAERGPVEAFAAGTMAGRPTGPATTALAAARVRFAGGPIPPARFLDLVRCDRAELARQTWDDACGLYQALRAAEDDLPAGTRPAFADAFAGLAAALALPGSHTTAGRTDSPARYDPDKGGPLFDELQRRLRAAARQS